MLTAFSEIQKAEADYNKAEQKHREYPQNPSGRIVDNKYIITAANALAAYETTKATLNNLRLELPNRVRRDIGVIRAELVQSLKAHYRANPADIDHDTLVLLDSGILNVDEYEMMLNQAQNPTMERLICNRCGRAAETASDEETASRLKYLAGLASNCDGTDQLDTFDSITSIAFRCLDNPSMIGEWSNLVQPLIDLM